MTSDHDHKINTLERNLESARETIIELLPKKFHDWIKRSYFNCQTIEDCSKWRSDLTQFVLDNAEIDPNFSYREQRAACPLCGSAGHSPYVEGYQVPDGLQMHLLGEMSARECQVMLHMQRMVIDSVHANQKMYERMAASPSKADRETAQAFALKQLEDQRKKREEQRQAKAAEAAAKRERQIVNLEPHQILGLRAVIAGSDDMLANINTFTLDVLCRMELLKRIKGGRGKQAFQITNDGKRALAMRDEADTRLGKPTLVVDHPSDR